MACKGCGEEHSPMIRCEVAARQRVSNSVSNAKEDAAVSNPEYLRVKLWREANRDRYNASQRETMRRRRMKAA